VHISTHGQFSSVPERTFLLAWDGLINVQKMAQTFQGTGNIDLLVLSACQTAAGDERSTLGLAGLAVQSGAQSAIASLWLVDSTGSSVLMDRFYQALDQGLTNIAALHQAQLTLMQSTDFSHPFYWAPFVLVGG
ncbi:MAG: CHAT domain-containing protein, partial [Cyanobacteria bacterium J06555_13]